MSRCGSSASSSGRGVKVLAGDEEVVSEDAFLLLFEPRLLLEDGAVCEESDEEPLVEDEELDEELELPERCDFESGGSFFPHVRKREARGSASSTECVSGGKHPNWSATEEEETAAPVPWTVRWTLSVMCTKNKP